MSSSNSFSPSKKCSHLYPMFCKYAEILSDEAKKYLVIDFNLQNELFKNPELTKDDDIRNIIVNGEKLVTLFHFEAQLLTHKPLFCPVGRHGTVIAFMNLILKENILE